MSHKIYSWHGNPRGDICRVAAEFAKVEYEFVNTPFAELKNTEYLAKHPLGKVPLLETPEGTLFETHAILKYFGRKCNLLGKTTFEEAQATQWLEWINSEFVKDFFPVYGQVIGLLPSDENVYKEARAKTFANLKYLNDYLCHNTYLAGEQLSVADISMVCWIAPLFWTVLEEGFRKGNFSLVRWYKHVLSYEPIKKFFRAPFMCKKEWISVKADKPAAAKKEKQAAPAKKAEQPKKEEVVVQEAKPAKNPLETLPESPFNLFDFKTFIVNEADKNKGVEEFFKQYDPKGFSIWHVKYDKYEGEGEKLFLTSNLKDSFLQRLDHFRKYVFGTYGVYGEPGNYDVEGIWVWRGTEIPQEIKDLPNYEYHFWTKLDHSKESDKDRLKAFWTGLQNDVSVVEGKVARDVQYFK